MSSATRDMADHEKALAELVPALNAHSEAVVLFHSSIAQSMGLDPTAYKTLFLLRRLGPLSAGEISAKTGLATASVTNLVDRLVAKGYVAREEDQKDRRRIVVTLIEEAVTDVRQSFAVPNPSLRELCERYEASQLEVIADFLARNAQRLRADMAQATSR